MFPSFSSLPAGKAYVTIAGAWQQKCGFPIDSVRCIRDAFCHKGGKIKRHPYTLTAKEGQLSIQTITVICILLIYSKLTSVRDCSSRTLSFDELLLVSFSATYKIKVRTRNNH